MQLLLAREVLTRFRVDLPYYYMRLDDKFFAGLPSTTYEGGCEFLLPAWYNSIKDGSDLEQ